MSAHVVSAPTILLTKFPFLKFPQTYSINATPIACDRFFKKKKMITNKIFFTLHNLWRVPIKRKGLFILWKAVRYLWLHSRLALFFL